MSSWSRRVFRLAVISCAIGAGNAAAESFTVGRTTLSTEMMILTGVDGPQAPEFAAPSVDVDYGIFSRELLAYVAKEVLPDAEDEYYASPIPSQLSDRSSLDTMARPERGNFGRHCRLVIGDLVSYVLGKGRDGEPMSFAAGVVQTTATAFVLRDVWSVFRHRRDEPESPRAFSLEPKISARKVEARISFRW
jgi:hypothetical protein